MNILRNYLESMFANLPNTYDVQRAKDELYTMMEDKYTELLSEGKPENEAVSIVISEFGNLDDLAGTLGIGGVIEDFHEEDRRLLSKEEAAGFLADASRHRFFIGLGVLLFIISPIGPILGEVLSGPSGIGEAIGISLFFVAIAGGVALIVYSSVNMKKYGYLRSEPCMIDVMTAEYLRGEILSWRANRAMYLTIGIILCILCFVPTVVFETATSSNLLADGIGPALLFVCIGIGVMLIIMSGGRENACKRLLLLNDTSAMAASYTDVGRGGTRYNNTTVEAIMSVYWQSVTCLYLIWSFLSFDWYITWIIWPIAAIINAVIRSIYGVKGGAYREQ